MKDIGRFYFNRIKKGIEICKNVKLLYFSSPIVLFIFYFWSFEISFNFLKIRKYFKFKLIFLTVVCYLDLILICIGTMLKVKSVQRLGKQIQPSKPKREITDITNSQYTKTTYGQPSEQIFPKKGGHSELTT